LAKLIVTEQERAYLVDLRLGESLTLGRSTDCDLPVAAPRASRRHAEIAAQGSGHVVRDLGSTNGTTLNGAPFLGEAPLKDGDVVEAGGCRVVYRSAP
jgi:pSer/pThr/pTyr-binding forkhead associated (FHA) protein